MSDCVGCCGVAVVDLMEKNISDFVISQVISNRRVVHSEIFFHLIMTCGFNVAAGLTLLRV